MNLVGNAIKFTEEGAVTIELKIIKETDLFVTIFFSVKDTGMGIPQNKLETIFERFEQAGKDISRKFGGSGLGLNISKNLVELQGGKLEVNSQVGKGSEFYFTISYEKVSESFEKNEEMNEKNKKSKFKFSNLNSLKLLVCEDNLVNVKLIQRLFDNKVASLEIAENGLMGIKLLKRKTFDVVLMDIHMPVMDGIESTKYIRNNLKLKIPIVGFSANNSVKDREICIKAGMNDCINKSFVSDEIYEKLLKIILTKKKFEEDVNPNQTKMTFKKRTCKKPSSKSVGLPSLNLLKMIGEHKIFEEFITNKNLNSHQKKLFKKKMTLQNESISFVNKNKINENCEELEIKKLKQNLRKKCSNKRLSYSNLSDTMKEDHSTSIVEESKSVNNSRNKSRSTIKNKRKIKLPDFKDKENINPNDKEITNLEEIINFIDMTDHVNLEQLKEFSGDDETFEKELIKEFITNFPKDFQNLANDFYNKKMKETKFWIHKIKSPLRMLGLSKILEQLEKLNKLCEHKIDSKLAQKLFTNVDNNLKLVYKELNELVQNDSLKVCKR
jgi:CheY-like chemotaxis protein/HPt (histidine-containing phosphotransfer) domain-containing protein